MVDADSPDDVADEWMEVATVLTVAASGAGDRLDKWLTGQLPDHSRSEIQRWIESGLVTRRGKPLKDSYRVTPGDDITVVIPPPQDYAVEPEPIPLDVLYEDADLLVINKPAGMVVHPAAGNWRGTLVNAILYRCPDLEGVGGTHRPGIVHRLDKDTSGVILVAKNDRAHRDLQAQFQERAVHKTYLALARGWLRPERAEINAAIGRDPHHRQRMGVVSASQGRMAITRYEVVKFYRQRVPQMGELFTLVACHPLTGRTHQIRVHLAYIRHPIVGDAVYGGHHRLYFDCPRQFLHAERIRFRLPGGGAQIEFAAALPADLQAVIEQLEAED